ncbi:pimeloyl-ACP methyl ester carboxylesterase [Micromonospora luteifusca]|uniref:Pimeloyl-ACP methyl ester carboxylesterase n=1 Tax=Micromonospora luteifusca TaxID=709860 RepID=A0ABS2LLQ6_9ACTN|nr:alpha/beta hydrolase [Micromonospora luteifusca]MBM7489119.1 pimeloyl-ACP methyl ester carboxylesterase [Micromonospora luteifusca]
MPHPTTGSHRPHRVRRPAALLAATLAAAVLGSGAAVAPAAAAKTAEPDTAALAASLATQQLSWEPCGLADVSPEDEAQLRLSCATVTVPRDWHNPRDGKTIQVRISRTVASGTDRKGILLVNPGGPGGSGLSLAPYVARSAPTVAEHYDVIGFDPRGVGQSTPLLCSVTYRDTDVTNDQITQANVAGCRGTELTKYITTEQTTYDMDFIRVLLGEQKLNYLGYSYGTWLGTWYAATFPSRTNRMVLDSVAAVGSPTLQETWDLQPFTRDRAFQEQLLPYMARHDDLYGRGTDPMAIRELFERAGGTRIGMGPFMFGFFILGALYDTQNYPTAAAAVNTVIEYYEEWNGWTPEQILTAATAKMLAAPGITADDRAYIEQSRVTAEAALKAQPGQVQLPQGTEEYTYDIDYVFEVIRCQDGQWNDSIAHWNAFSRRLTRDAPLVAPFLQNPPACAYWPTSNRMPTFDQKTFPKVLMLQDELDVATAYEGALAASKKLPGASMISVDNEGSHGVFPYYTSCVDDAVYAYLLDGRLPAEKYTGCQAVPLPGDTAVFEVGGKLTGKGTVRTSLITDDMRAANRMLKRMLRTEPGPSYPE